jgi:hypothetical protein
MDGTQDGRDLYPDILSRIARKQLPNGIWLFMQGMDRQKEGVGSGKQSLKHG